MSWVQPPDFIFISWVTLGKSLELIEPQFPSSVKWESTVAAMTIKSV